MLSKKMRNKLPKKSQRTSVRNNKTRRTVMSKKMKLELKNIEKRIKNQTEIREYALQNGNLEVYGYSNKILLVLLMDLVAKKTDESIKLANKYSKKTGIEIPTVNLSSKVPNPKKTVKSIQNSYYHPPATATADALKWE